MLALLTRQRDMLKTERFFNTFLEHLAPRVFNVGDLQLAQKGLFVTNPEMRALIRQTGSDRVCFVFATLAACGEVQLYVSQVIT